MAKGQGLRGASTRIPTPESGSTTGATGNKRRRTDNYAMPGSDIYQDESDEQDEAPEVQAEDDANDNDDENLRFYNPNQDPEQRRQLRARMRDHRRMVDGESGHVAITCPGHLH